MKVQAILSGHKSGEATPDLVECIEACFECAQACTTCADACLVEDKVGMLARCIRTDLDCADMCATTGRILSRRTEPDPSIISAQVQALATACQVCAEECDKHASKHEHCRVCAEACRRCEKSCNKLVGAAV